MSGVVGILVLGLTGFAVVMLIAWAIYDACDGFDLSKSIDRGIAEGIEEGFKPGGAVDSAIDRVLRKIAEENKAIPGALTQVGFVWQMAFEFMRTDRTMKADDARDLAAATLREFLSSEKIAFGDQAYGWGQQEAIVLAREIETEHWEAA